MSALDEKAIAVLVELREEDHAHSGPGWYYWSQDYPDEGSVGAFDTREAALAHLTEADHVLDESS